MTPAIQKQIEIHTRSEAEAAAQSLNLSHIFKKMKPFPEKMDRPPLVVGLDLGRGEMARGVPVGEEIRVP